MSWKIAANACGYNALSRHSLPVDYTASISPDNTTWTGKARFPASYLPPRITHWNAYAIHGTGEAREYSALYGGPGPQPDFHRLENFRPLGTGP